VAASAFEPQVAAAPGPSTNRRSITGIQRKRNAGTAPAAASADPAFDYRDMAEKERRF